METELIHYISQAIHCTPDSPDIYIDVSVLKSIAKYDGGYCRSVKAITDLCANHANMYGGVVIHLNIQNISIGYIRKYGIPLIQTFNRMIDQNLVPDMSQSIRKTFVYFSSDVVRSIMNLVRPLLNPSVFNSFHILTKSESADYFKTIMPLMSPHITQPNNATAV